MVEVDWTLCRASGVCAEVLPDWLGLDPWGFPVIPDTLPPELARQARRAARLCPNRALAIEAARGADSDPAGNIAESSLESITDHTP